MAEAVTVGAVEMVIEFALFKGNSFLLGFNFSRLCMIIILLILFDLCIYYAYFFTIISFIFH